MDILTPLFRCLRRHVPATTLRQVSRITRALLVMTGRITMLGRQRGQLAHRAAQVYLLAGDEVVVTKAGKHTYGLERFFAGLYGKPVPGVSFFALSQVSVQARRAFPIRIAQVVRSDAAKAARRTAQPCQLHLISKRRSDGLTAATGSTAVDLASSRLPPQL